MKRFIVLMMVAAITVCSFGFAAAGSSSEEARAMVDKAAAYVQADGKDKALKEFNNPNGKFVKGDLYIFAYDMNGTLIAHPINAKLVGMNLLNAPDIDGKFYRREIIELAKKSGSGTVDYKYKNPANGKIEHKTTHLKRAGDMVICCGAYK
ncbi:MAG: cache type 2 domain-containing protein [Deltaproteobacteria bacterium]|nr:cache type 2 domain-containing protein [Deltaproteobacteria bacterium]